MDLRITNTCNNDCIYCLEQSLRNENPYVPKEDVFRKLNKKADSIVGFYGGNPLLHPDLLEIISYAKGNAYEHISLLTNTFGLSEPYLERLIAEGLDGVGFYFNSFDEDRHSMIVNSGISLKELEDNIGILVKSGIFLKCIIHLNNINIKTIYEDVLTLNKKYKITDFEFVNFFPFDRPYEKFKDKVFFDFKLNKIHISRLFKVLELTKPKVRFHKFDRDFFFGKASLYNGICLEKQIGIEDFERMNSDNPFCLSDKRCKLCFIKEFCKHYK